MCVEMRQLSVSREIRERAQVIALLRFYRVRWRVWDPEGGRFKSPSRQAKQPRTAPKARHPRRAPVAVRDTIVDTRQLTS